MGTRGKCKKGPITSRAVDLVVKRNSKQAGIEKRVTSHNSLNMPCFNPMLEFTKDDILTLIKSRYGLSLNPVYKHMDRTYCLCCYTSDSKRQAYNSEDFPEECEKYYGQIEKMLFDSGLLDRVPQAPERKTRTEKLDTALRRSPEAL